MIDTTIQIQRYGNQAYPRAFSQLKVSHTLIFHKESEQKLFERHFSRFRMVLKKNNCWFFDRYRSMQGCESIFFKDNFEHFSATGSAKTKHR